MSSSYHPQSNGQTESTNKTIKTMIKCYVNDHMDDWDENLIAIEIAINNAVQDSTGYSPFYLNSGQSPNLPLSLAASAEGSGRQRNGEVKESVSEWARRLQADLQEATINMQSAQEAQRKQANKSRREVRYKIGDQVLMLSDNLSSHKSKLRPNYVGPFKVIKVCSEVLLELDLPPALEIHSRVHVEKLKAFSEDPTRFPTRRQVNRQMAVFGKRKKKEWEVERIVAEREVDGVMQYLVLWLGWNTTDATWEPEENLEHAQEILAEWRQLQQRTEGQEEGELDQNEGEELDEEQERKYEEAKDEEEVSKDGQAAQDEEREEEWSRGSNRQVRRSTRLRKIRTSAKK